MVSLPALPGAPAAVGTVVTSASARAVAVAARLGGGTPTPSPSGLTLFAGAPPGTDIGPFTGTLGAIVFGDRPITHAAYTTEYLKQNGGRVSAGGDI